MGMDDSFKPGVTETGPKGQLAHPTTSELNDMKIAIKTRK